jgi:hypothetical protein
MMPRYLNHQKKKGNSFYGEKMERSDRKCSRKDHVCSRHFKEEFIIKNSVNDGAPLSRWIMRDAAIPTHFLGKLRFINNSCIIHELILNYAEDSRRILIYYNSAV